MKKILIFLIFVIIPLGFYFRAPVKAQAEKVLYHMPCNKPITYRIGSIDEEFNVSQEQFQQSIYKAGYIWSDAAGKNLFQYKPDGEIAINLIYDQRQFLNSQVNELDNKLKEQQKSLDPEIAEYKRKAAEYRARIDQLNSDIEGWNSKGGAPPDEYAKLKSQQTSLQQEAIVLQEEARRLNQTTDEYNSKVGELSQTVDNFNQALQYKPEEGEYIVEGGKKTINVYFDNSETELVHTLAHELGHALIIDHNNNEASIMFPRTTQVITLSQDDLSGLEEACARQSVVENARNNFSLFMYQLGKNMQNIQLSPSK